MRIWNVHIESARAVERQIKELYFLRDDPWDGC